MSYSNLADTPLIPLADLFGNPDRDVARISPDGLLLAWLAPLEGVMNLWVAPRGRLDEARALTQDRGRGIGTFVWAYDDRHLLYMQDQGGDENFHVWAIASAGGAPRDLTPSPGSRGLLSKLSRRRPGEVLVTLNRRDPRFADLYRVDIGTGEMILVQENPGFAGFVTDDDFSVQFASRPQPDGGSDYLRPTRDGGWRPWLSLSPDDAHSGGMSHLDATGRTLYFFDNRGRDIAALVAFDVDSSAATAAPRVLAEHSRADISGVLVHHETYAPLAYSATYQRRELHVLDERIRPDLEFLDSRLECEWSIESRSRDDRFWTLGTISDVVPRSAYLFDRSARRLDLLYGCRSSLAGAPLARMQATILRSRDGLNLVSYLTLPVHADRQQAELTSRLPLPLVLLVHGGPWSRDSFGYNPTHQWLANRGYAVLSVNFRSSTGFGKGFISAGDHEWGAKMDDDLVDAVDWAIERGIADPGKIAIMGGSYGGYATLWSMTAHPLRYACGVDIVGPSDLETLLAAIPPQWEAGRAMLHRALGDPATEEGSALLRSRSPVHRADEFRRPLLIGQGANDPRVKQRESDQMVAAMQRNGVPVTYVLFPDEGHGFARPPNRILFNLHVERFLARHLGGRFQEIVEEDIEGNSAVVRAGGDDMSQGPTSLRR